MKRRWVAAFAALMLWMSIVPAFADWKYDSRTDSWYESGSSSSSSSSSKKKKKSSSSSSSSSSSKASSSTPAPTATPDPKGGIEADGITQGMNLLENLLDHTEEASGVTYTPNENGSFTLEGIPEGKNYFSLNPARNVPNDEQLELPTLFTLFEGVDYAVSGVQLSYVIASDANAIHRLNVYTMNRTADQALLIRPTEDMELKLVRACFENSDEALDAYFEPMVCPVRFAEGYAGRSLAANLLTSDTRRVDPYKNESIVYMYLGDGRYTLEGRIDEAVFPLNPTAIPSDGALYALDTLCVLEAGHTYALSRAQLGFVTESEPNNYRLFNTDEQSPTPDTAMLYTPSERVEVKQLCARVKSGNNYYAFDPIFEPELADTGISLQYIAYGEPAR